jgi:integrase
LLNVPVDVKQPWYYAIPMGKNSLAKMMHDVCFEAGIKGNKTNHSLRVAGTTCLHEAGVPEKVIQQRTGHRSSETLRVCYYETGYSCFKNTNWRNRGI